MCGDDCTIRAVASIPLSRGMCRSIRITSGCSSRARSTASRPSTTLPTTSTVSVAASIASSPLRNCSWSSTTRTRNRSISPLPDLVPARPPGAASLRPACPCRRRMSPCRCRRAPPRAPAWTTVRCPDGVRAPMPTPESRASMCRTSSSRCRTTRQVSDSLCWVALVTASTTIQYAATSTAAGSGPRSSSASIAQVRPRSTAVHSGGEVVLVGSLAQCGDEAELVECRRPQPVDEPAHLGDLLAGLLGELTDQVLGLGRVVGDQVAGRLEPHRQRGQRRSEPVVQVAAHPAALLLAGGDDVLPGPLQVAVDRDRLDERAHLGADVLEQPTVGGAEGVAVGVHLQQQSPDLRAADDQLDRRSPTRGARRTTSRAGPRVASPNTSMAAQESRSRRASSTSVSFSASVGAVRGSSLRSSATTWCAVAGRRTRGGAASG